MYKRQLLDSAHIQEKDALFFNKKNDDRRDEDGFTFRDPLYTSVDVDSAMKLFVGYGYDQWHKIHDDVRVMFTDAGHILGSAAVTLEIRENGKTTIDVYKRQSLPYALCNLDPL